MANGKWRIELRTGCSVYELASLLRRARAKARPHIATIGRVEISIRASNHSGTSSPAAASQHLVITEPRRGIFLVRARLESRVSDETGVRPLPDVADHLAASERAVARGKGVDFYTTHRLPIQTSAVQSRRFAAPRIQPLVV